MAPGQCNKSWLQERFILSVPPPLLGGLSSVSGICHLLSVLGASLFPFFTKTTEKIKYNKGRGGASGRGGEEVGKEEKSRT